MSGDIRVDAFEYFAVCWLRNGDKAVRVVKDLKVIRVETKNRSI